ncbi:MAG: N-acetylglucosamine-6-phosphate deacetylase [Victivallales bacterium]|nr:N-acetylglucosamine-6-phosphate deacetylase [Victivallales bacterium]
MFLKEKDLSRRVLYLVDYCLTPSEHIVNAGILCEDNLILALGGSTAFNREEGLKVVELKGCYAAPGFIDTHIHGAGGFDSSAAFGGIDKLGSMCRTLASHGMTSFVPTIVSEETDKMLKAIELLASAVDKDFHGAIPAGVNVEGPFINPEKHGAQQTEHIRPVDLGEARELIAAGKGHVKMMTFAPELDRADELVAMLRENNTIPSMGHSTAEEQAVLRAIDAGATRCTHLFNGMNQLHQRSIGLTALALVDNRVDVELILDGALIHPRMIELACRAKPKDKIIGISDAVEGMGMSDGSYHIGESEIRVQNGKVTTLDGTIAGTTQSLEKGWQHLAEASHMKRTEAAACLTINPAKSIGLSSRGELVPGKFADIAFFDAVSHNVRLTVSGGHIVFDSEKQGGQDG